MNSKDSAAAGQGAVARCEPAKSRAGAARPAQGRHRM